MKSFIVLIALVAVAVANPVGPLVQLIVNINAAESAVADVPISEPSYAPGQGAVDRPTPVPVWEDWPIDIIDVMPGLSPVAPELPVVVAPEIPVVVAPPFPGPIVTLPGELN